MVTTLRQQSSLNDLAVVGSTSRTAMACQNRDAKLSSTIQLECKKYAKSAPPFGQFNFTNMKYLRLSKLLYSHQIALFPLTHVSFSFGNVCSSWSFYFSKTL